MNTATAPRSTSAARFWREASELLSSMRFAIALLTVICIASVIGTVVQQQQPSPNYVNQFGPFWAQLFGMLGLYAVYGSWWFLLILAFLVTSTSLCIARNVPKILADLRTFKESVREQSLLAFHHKAEGQTAESPEQAQSRVGTLLTSQGWRVKVQTRGNGVMLAAKKGAANKIGYIAAHSAIVLICLGGLFDGDLVVRVQMWAQGLTPIVSGPINPQDPTHRLSERNPAFRGNLAVAEGTRANVAMIALPSGTLLQPLPFDVELKQFKVDYYNTGMPKLFASDVVIHDRETGHTLAGTVQVNHPLIYKGVAIYQSSFEDGGSKLALRATPLGGGGGVELHGTVGSSQMLPEALSGGQPMMLELTDLRVINVENLGAPDAAASGVDVRKVDLASQLGEHLGSGDKAADRKNLRNVGPSMTFKLRDAAGQAREFQNYMRPVELDGARVFLAGMRENPADPMRYLRIPADENDSVAGWLRLRAALNDPAMRAEAVKRYVALALPAGRPDLAPQLTASASHALGLFAGAEHAKQGSPAPGGLQGISDFIEASVPPAERERASEVLIRIVNGTLFELLNLSREQAGQPRLPTDDATRRFMATAVLSLSDSFFYPSPVWLELDSFEQVQASIFQVAKAPGQKVVYLGCLLLTLGVFAMLYIRERRLWVWLQPAENGGTTIRTAFSSNRQTLDADREFERLQAALLLAPATEESA
ncbi:cytochrome c biogenesis protein ResB [Aquabacterium sp.]|uniref:cytochrome c biogenesis protein ResB n=1 Tax=Aquabacterium sp. TaxID=1872578 RepID=UPI0035B30844